MNDLSVEFSEASNVGEMGPARLGKIDIPDISQFPIPTTSRRQLTRQEQIKLMVIKPSRDKGFEEIPENGVMIDYGCGDGDLGAVVASERRCHLIQADLRDNRVSQYQNGPLVAVPEHVPPAFNRPIADAILLQDVLQHVRPYEGMSPEETKLSFLKGLLTGLKPEGKIIITSANESSAKLKEGGYLEKLVEEDEQLRGRAIIRL